jgi:transposase-like protein
MENTNLPLLIWFRAVALISMTKKSISAKDLQRQLKLKRYQPAWEMSHKIRAAMGKRDDDYWLEGNVEVDEGFFKSCEHPKKFEINSEDQKDTESSEKNEATKRGRGSQEQSAVVVMIESVPAEKKKKNKKANKIGYLKMKLIQRQNAQTIVPVLKNSINFDSAVQTDGFRAYNDLCNHFEKHQVTITKDKTLTEEYFPWVHTMISNAKRLFLGIHHKIGKGYMQLYLNEVCYKFNRRYMRENLVYSIINACINCPAKPVYTMRSCG